MIQLQALAERVRGSLFYVPLLYVAAAGVVAWGALRLDETVVSDLTGVPVFVATTVASARSILSTIAGATITVAGIVFSVTVVSVQLASSQYSPRVLRNFLRDRLQQNVIGVVVGTFTYCMFVLASIRVAEPGVEAEAAPSLAVTLAIVLAVASILAIVAFIDHSARAMQAGEIIGRVTTETRTRIGQRYVRRDRDRPPVALEEAEPPLGEPRQVLRAWRDGWIQQISADTLLGVAPPGGYLRLESQVGSYVIEDTPLLTVWGEGDVDDAAFHSGFVFGGSRTLQQDVAFGIRQLVDVGLRALSPGINDPTTAYEVIVHLGSILAELYEYELPPRVHTGEEGRLLAIPDRADHADHVEHAFGQLRSAAAAQPALLLRLLDVLEELDRLLVDRGLAAERRAIEDQVELVIEVVEHADLTPTDRRRVLDRAGELAEAHR